MFSSNFLNIFIFNGLIKPTATVWELGAAFKGTIYEECVYGGTIPHRDYNIQALDLLLLEEKDWSPGVGHTGGSTANSNFSANSNLYSKRL